MTSDAESDPFSIVIVDDLLQGINDWRNIQDIIRLTFQALTDIVRNQGYAIKDIEKQIYQKVSQSDVMGMLGSQANISEVSRSISELASTIDSKISIKQIQRYLEDKADQHQLKKETSNIYNQLEQLQREINDGFSSFVSLQDLKSLQAQLNDKADLAEMNDALQTQANKQSVANALHRKANRADVETSLAQKVQTSDMQNLLVSLDSKVDISVIDQITRILESKSDKTDTQVLVNHIEEKADIAEIENIIGGINKLKKEMEHRLVQFDQKNDQVFEELERVRFNLTNSINKQPEGKDFERLASQLVDQADLLSFNKLKSDIHDDLTDIRNELSLQKRSHEENFLVRFGKTQSSLDQVREDLIRQNELFRASQEERRNDVEETTKFVRTVNSNTKKELSKELDNIQEMINSFKNDFVHLCNGKTDKQEFLETRAQLFAILEEKVDLIEVQNALNASQADISSRFLQFKDEVQSSNQMMQGDLLAILNKKANSQDITMALNLKADTNIVQSQLGQRVTIGQLEDLRQIVEKLFKEIQDKASGREFFAHQNAISAVVEELQRESILKANIKDVCTLLDTKSNCEDTNQILFDIHRELERKANQDDLQGIVSDQAIINQSLCTQNIVGRWTWKSGEIKSGSLVPWQMQVVNTLPDNFLWEREKTSILIVAPGLYQFTAGFYGKQKPSIQILVNGEPILSAVNTASYVVHHSSGKLQDIKHSAGQITGLTLVDFLVLPARARLSIAFTGQHGGEGFIGLQRL